VSMADNRVSILARQAQMGTDVNTAAVDQLLAEALQSAGAVGPEEPADVRYYRSLLRAAQG